MLPRIFLDIDNTLIKPFSKLSQENYEAIQAYVNAGGNVHLITGKVTYAIIDLVTELNLEHLVHAGANGGMVLENGEEKLIHTLNVRSEEVINILKKLGIDYYVFYKDRIGYSHKQPIEYQIKKMIAINEPTPVFETNHDYKNVIKVLIYIESNIEFENKLKDSMSGINNILFMRTATDLFEFMDIGMSKVNAVKYINKNNDKSIAMGDSQNDLSMLEYCDKAYVVSNASNDLKELFKVVPSCEDNGVAYVINSILEKESGL